MRFIPTKVHGLLDYIVGMALITAPWTFDFSDMAKVRGQAIDLVPILLGIFIILYSLFTDYEFGVARKIPMGIHLIFDFVGGAFLAVSPWLFGFANQAYLPHLIIGLLSVAASLFTNTHPGNRSQEADEKKMAATL